MDKSRILREKEISFSGPIVHARQYLFQVFTRHRDLYYVRVSARSHMGVRSTVTRTIGAATGGGIQQGSVYRT